MYLWLPHQQFNLHARRTHYELTWADRLQIDRQQDAATTNPTIPFLHKTPQLPRSHGSGLASDRMLLGPWPRNRTRYATYCAQGTVLDAHGC